MSAIEAGPAILVLDPPNGGGSLLTRGLSGHPKLEAFNDGGLILSLLQAADGTLQAPVPAEGDSPFDPAEIEDAVTSVLGASASQRQAFAVRTATEQLQTRLAAGGRPYALHAVGCAERVDILGALFPEAAIVHVVRDPRTVVLQAARLGVVPRPLGELASEWLRETTGVLLFGLANPGRVLRVPYESLLSEPQPTCERLCQALGLPPEPEAMAAAMRVGLRAEEELVFHRGALDHDEVLELEHALQPLLALLGFRPATLTGEGGGEPVGTGERRMSLADEVTYLRAERDRFADELQELRRALDADPQHPHDIDVLRWKAKRYDRLRAAATPLRLLKRLRRG